MNKEEIKKKEDFYKDLEEKFGIEFLNIYSYVKNEKEEKEFIGIRKIKGGEKEK
jgi:hypothetical protein